MAFSYVANPFISQSEWNQITSKVNQPATPRVGQARQNAAAPRNSGFTSTYKPNPYVSQDQWNSMVPGFRADWEARQQKSPATPSSLPDPPSGGIDMSAYRPGQAQPNQSSIGEAYSGVREAPSAPATYSPSGGRGSRRAAADAYLQSVRDTDPSNWSDAQIDAYNQAARDSMISHMPSYSRDANGNVVRTNWGHTGPTREVFDRQGQAQPKTSSGEYSTPYNQADVQPRPDWGSRMNLPPGAIVTADFVDTDSDGRDDRYQLPPSERASDNSLFSNGLFTQNEDGRIARQASNGGTGRYVPGSVDAYLGSRASRRQYPTPASAPAIATSSTSQSQPPAAISPPPQQQAVSPPSNIIGSGPMQGLPEGTKIIRGPQGGFVFPGTSPPGFTQQPNGGYRPSQQPPLPQGFVPGQHVFSALPPMPEVRQPSFAVTQDPGFSTPPPSIPEPGFSASYTDLMGNVSDQPNYVQRDALIDLLNQSLLPYQTGNRTGPPQYDIPALLSQADEMAQSGYQNPFAFSNFNANPLAGLFA